MKLKLIPLLIITTLISSCRHSDYDKKILGDWKLVAVSSKYKNHTFIHHIKDNLWFSKDGYSFFNNNIVDNKLGFRGSKQDGYPTLNSITKYKIDGDILSVYDLADSVWQKSKIISLDADTLKIQKLDDRIDKLDTSKIRYIYLRQHYKPDNNISFDQIVLTNYSFWGTGDNIILSADGHVSYRIHQSGNRFYKSRVTKGNKDSLLQQKDGIGFYLKQQSEKFIYYSAKISIAKFDSIKKSFLIAHLSTAKDDYNNGGADGPEVSVSFINNGKIVKSIHDYEKSAPPEFIWAYTTLQYLPETLKLDSIDSSLGKHDILSIRLKKDAKEYSLGRSVSFYLWNLIKRAKETKQTFSKKFDLNFYYSDEISQIQTDGQLYQITYKNGIQKTYDIGFNFITRNADFIKFTDKKNNE